MTQTLWAKRSALFVQRTLCYECYTSNKMDNYFSTFGLSNHTTELETKVGSVPNYNKII